MYPKKENRIHSCVCVIHSLPLPLSRYLKVCTVCTTYTYVFVVIKFYDVLNFTNTWLMIVNCWITWNLSLFYHCSLHYFTYGKYLLLTTSIVYYQHPAPPIWAQYVWMWRAWMCGTTSGILRSMKYGTLLIFSVFSIFFSSYLVSLCDPRTTTNRCHPFQ